MPALARRRLQPKPKRSLEDYVQECAPFLNMLPFLMEQSRLKRRAYLSRRYRMNARGVEFADQQKGMVRCRTCGHVWQPNIRSGGRMHRGWMRCPQGCNAP